MGRECKDNMAVLQAHSLRELIEQVNEINKGASKILKEDIVTILKEDETFFLLYFR